MPKTAPAAQATKVQTAAANERFPTLQRLFDIYSPNHWDRILTSPERAVACPAPLLCELDPHYGADTSIRWLTMQLAHTYGLDIDADMKRARAMAAFAREFGALCRRRSLTEMMLFFARFRMGVDGGTFNGFDPRALGHAFNHSFLPALSAIRRTLSEREREAERRRQSALTPDGGRRPGAVSREEYEAMTDYDVTLLILRPEALAPLRRLAVRPARWPEAHELPASLTLRIRPESWAEVDRMREGRLLKVEDEG